MSVITNLVPSSTELDRFKILFKRTLQHSPGLLSKPLQFLLLVTLCLRQPAPCLTPRHTPVTVFLDSLKVSSWSRHGPFGSSISSLTQFFSVYSPTRIQRQKKVDIWVSCSQPYSCYLVQCRHIRNSVFIEQMNQSIQ